MIHTSSDVRSSSPFLPHQKMKLTRLLGGLPETTLTLPAVFAVDAGLYPVHLGSVPGDFK